MLLESIKEYFKNHNTEKHNACFIVGGFANFEDGYCQECMEISKEFPPDQFYMSLESPFSFQEVKIINAFSDFGVVPSLFEPGGLVQMEFLAASTPVICSRTGGLLDTVTDFRKSKLGNGLLCEPGDPESLLEALLHAV